MNDQNKSADKSQKNALAGRPETRGQDEKSGRALVWMYAIAIVVGLPLIYQLAKFVLARTTM